MLVRMTATFTSSEAQYLTGQTLARLATVRCDGSLQNNPVAFVVDGNSIVIGGYDLTATQKFRNLATNTNVALVADDIESSDPWVVRGVEIRGQAVAEVDVDPPVEWMSRSLIRILPDRVISWGVNEETVTGDEVATS